MNTRGEYNSWRAMIARCEDPEHPSWEHYGGRGIQVCARWRYSFASFFLDMGPRPAGSSLDRINVNLGYNAANCRWSSATVQRGNRRRVELTGQRFGRLVVLHGAGAGPDGRARWLCLCVCGQETTVDGASLRKGNTQSCGCLSRDRARERMRRQNGETDGPGQK